MCPLMYTSYTFFVHNLDVRAVGYIAQTTLYNIFEETLLVCMKFTAKREHFLFSRPLSGYLKIGL